MLFTKNRLKLRRFEKTIKEDITVMNYYKSF